MAETSGNATIAFEYPKEAIVSYTQTRADVLLWRALHSVNCGFYVDVGPHDPTELSVTRAFYERGWHGINVEPLPLYAEKLRKERPRDVILEAALGAGPGQTTIYDFGSTGLSTGVKQIAEGHVDAGFQPTKLRVSVTTLEAILADFGEQEIHFLKIDVEGYEREVLSGATLQKHRPWIILLESVKPASTSYSEWEPLVLEAGYQFAYFDGLNRYYVSNEHADLKRYFSVPVSIVDPFRDYEVVRLSTALAALERGKIKHEVPRLGRDAHACGPDDAAGLVRVVETQAADLVQLRRALVAQQSLVAELRKVASSPTKAEMLHREAKISDWLRSIALADLALTQAEISKLSERSAWLRLGQLLGMAKLTDWSAGNWQSNLVKLNEGGASHGSARVESPSVSDILAELRRLKGLLEDFSSCRWLALGRLLKLAKRSRQESSTHRDPLLLEPFPDEALEPLSGETKSNLPSSGHESFVEHTDQRFLEQCRNFAIDVILDIGANTGEFVRALRVRGYHGHVVSFEPLSSAHAELAMAAHSDPLWDVAERCAIGARDDWAEINISANSYSSSLLPMLDLLRDATPQAEYLGKEPCRVVTLDSYIEQTFSDPTTLFAAKIDTQGYEAEVLSGLKRNHDRVKVILCEMSVAPLYAHGPSMGELCHLLAELNYHCVALSPEFEDARTGELLQTNGVFVKRE